MRNTRIAMLLVVLAACIYSPRTLPARQLEPAVEAGVERVERAAQAQEKINSLSEEIEQKIETYKALEKQIQGLEVYIEQLRLQLDNQDREVIGLNRSIDNVTRIERQITPLMLRMIDALQQFVSMDVPFLPEERKARVSRLQDLIGRADVSVAEKFRAVFDAYQTEMEYGRTIEAYRGMLETPEGRREVDFLRIGRIGLYYMTLDGSLLGMWNQESGQWETLSAGYRPYLVEGLRIAREQAAPDLIRLPLPRPEKAAALNVAAQETE